MKTQQGNPYWRLSLMVLASFVSMYVLMYAMVDSLAHVYNSVNEFYMAGLMTMPMIGIELVVMAAMYPKRRVNAALLAASIVVGIACWFGIRYQTGVTDQQFLRSMIPHHAGAILMCGSNHLTDADLKKLCQEISESQQREIAEMKAKLR